ASIGRKLGDRCQPFDPFGPRDGRAIPGSPTSEAGNFRRFGQSAPHVGTVLHSSCRQGGRPVLGWAQPLQCTAKVPSARYAATTSGGNIWLVCGSMAKGIVRTGSKERRTVGVKGIVIRSLGPVAATEITGIDLAQPLDGPTFTKIDAAFDR